VLMDMKHLRDEAFFCEEEKKYYVITFTINFHSFCMIIRLIKKV
jgi:hypothetical protein